MWNEIMVLFKNYIGNGWAAGLFLVSFIYLMFVEKDRVKRIILLYTSAVTVALFFFPLFVRVVFRYLDEETYYRVLWLVPMTAVIAYAGIRFAAGFSGKMLQAAAALLSVPLLSLRGITSTIILILDRPQTGFMCLRQWRLYATQSLWRGGKCVRFSRMRCCPM